MVTVCRYYQPEAIKKQFGRIVDYQAAPDRHPGSIMSLSSTGGHGRGDQNGRIIGASDLKPVNLRNISTGCLNRSFKLAQPCLSVLEIITKSTATGASDDLQLFKKAKLMGKTG